MSATETESKSWLSPPQQPHHTVWSIPHHLHGKDTLPMQPKPTQKPTPAWEIQISDQQM